jgi:hypothetical protein
VLVFAGPARARRRAVGRRSREEHEESCVLMIRDVLTRLSPRPKIRDNADTVEFIDATRSTPALFTENLATALRWGPHRPDFVERVFVIRKLSMNIDSGQADRLLPHWMSRRGIFRISCEVSSARLWLAIFSEASEAIQAHPGTGSISDDYAKAAKAVAINNAENMTSAIILGLLAAAIGPDITQCVQPVAKRRINTAFAEVVGRGFEGPVSSVDELMSRMGRLLPSPGAAGSQRSGSLLTLFLRHGVFDNVANPALRCPGIGIARLLLDQWGRQLAEDELYRDRFIATVTSTYGGRKTPSSAT